MNVIRCANGHFFDGDTYESCPHCGAATAPRVQSVTVGAEASALKKEDKKPLRGKNNKEKGKAKTPPTPLVSKKTPVTPETFGDGSEPTEVLEFNLAGNSKSSLKADKTLDFWQTSSHPETIDPQAGGAVAETAPEEVAPVAETEDVPAPEAAPEVAPVEVPVAEEPVAEEPAAAVVAEAAPVAAEEPAEEDAEEETEEEAEEDVEEEIEEEAPAVPAVSLQEAIKNASANSEGKTMSYFSSATSAAAESAKPHKAADPVVGWLVCVGGAHFGETFNIYAGKNSIGRSAENRIAIADVNSISRSKHALIVYEPKKRNFYLQPGDSSGLTYLNDDYITESTKLTARDIIELGDCQFMFVPLCGADFTWEEHMPKGE